jgi:hypothetical protein
MTSAWIDRIAVATILLAAVAYLGQRAVRRVASAFRREAKGASACGTDCGCDP